MKTSIKRNYDGGGIGSIGSLDNLFGYSPEDVENERKVETSDEVNLKLALCQYHSCEDTSFNAMLDFKTSLVLTPKEISQFLFLIKFNFINDENLKKTSLFMNKLIQNSYDFGYNQFNLDLNNYPDSCFLCRELIGEVNNPLRVDINGDVEYSTCYGAKNLIVSLSGHAGEAFADNTNNLVIHVKGNAGRFFGWQSNDSYAIVKGNVGDHFFSYSENSTAVVFGDTKEYFGSSGLNCMIVKSPDSRQHQIYNEVMRRMRGESNE